MVVARDRIEAGRRLVVQQDARLHRHRARDRDAAPLSARQLRRLPIDELRQPDEAEHLFDALADHVERLIGFLVQLVADVLGDGQRVEQRAFLKDHADVGAHFHHLLFGVVVDELAVHPDLAGVRLQQAENQLQRDRFAGAARAQDDLRVAAAEARS